jgi:peptidoglycan/xylan/chitin deacetylase (PgdA/CDA1 family)
MYINWLTHSKGPRLLVRRLWNIIRIYGLKPTRMEQALERFIAVLKKNGAQATLPITAVTLARQPAVARRIQARGIELAVHGWTHVPLANLSAAEQCAHLSRAQHAFAASGIRAVGFRAPYLSRNDNLLDAAKAAGLSYVSNQPILWDVLDDQAFDPTDLAAYERAVDFYQPWLAKDRPSLPQLHHQLVEIPVSLPDDEMLDDRLRGNNGLVEKAWGRILADTYQRGELFTIQLHPERIIRCADALSAVLAEARTFTPSVWLARLDEIAAWWVASVRTNVEIVEVGNGDFQLTVAGPSGTTVLARAIAVDAPTEPWADGYRQVKSTTFAIHAPLRPFIGLSPATSPELVSFLRQQGYLVEISEESHHYSYYFDHETSSAGKELKLLTTIEGSDQPLVRLGRWPDGARSALAVTGDIDALTLWDYGLRVVGK